MAEPLPSKQKTMGSIPTARSKQAERALMFKNAAAGQKEFTQPPPTDEQYRAFCSDLTKLLERHGLARSLGYDNRTAAATIMLGLADMRTVSMPGSPAFGHHFFHALSKRCGSADGP